MKLCKASRTNPSKVPGEEGDEYSNDKALFRTAICMYLARIISFLCQRAIWHLSTIGDESPNAHANGRPGLLITP